jgi:hypothetical protein
MSKFGVDSRQPSIAARRYLPLKEGLYVCYLSSQFARLGGGRFRFRSHPTLGLGEHNGHVRPISEFAFLEHRVTARAAVV